MSFFSDSREQLKRSSTLQRLLIVNIAVFLFILVTDKVMGLFQLPAGDFLGNTTLWLAVPSSIEMLITRPWTLVTYMFLHMEFYHILFNMLWLYWMGQILGDYLGSKKLFSTYILGGISGALLYVLANNIFPLFRNSGIYPPMMGASASVMAITVAAATLIPDFPLNIFFIRIPIKFIAIAYVLLDLVSISNNDHVAHFAHLGGAFYGFLYVRRLKKGNDLAGWFNRLMDKASVLFRSSSRPGMKVKYKRAVDDESYLMNKKAKQERTDEILDKISKSGYGSLTREEKEFLFKSSKE